MSLPIEWIEKIFKKLSVTYGRDFLGRYEGVPLAEVKADWAHELKGFECRPEAIRHALLTLNASKAPTVYEFRNVCSNAPKMAALELPAPAQDPAVVAAICSGLRNGAPTGWRDWAQRLKSRHEAGDKLSMFQIASYRTALGIEAKETA